MPLRDHFHPPLSERRQWASFHSRWSNTIADALTEILPPGYYADPEAHAGSTVEIDVATFEYEPIVVGPKVYAPLTPAIQVATAFADDFEVKVFRQSGGAQLVAAIELVSPANKDRPENRSAFVHKCASYLHNGVALVVIDVVTDRMANLHDAILRAVTVEDLTRLYAVAYRPILRAKQELVEVWPEVLAIGGNLPTLPVWLSAVQAVPLDLEATYTTMLERAKVI